VKERKKKASLYREGKKKGEDENGREKGRLHNTAREGGEKKEVLSSKKKKENSWELKKDAKQSLGRRVPFVNPKKRKGGSGKEPLPREKRTLKSLCPSPFEGKKKKRFNNPFRGGEKEGRDVGGGKGETKRKGTILVLGRGGGGEYQFAFHLEGKKGEKSGFTKKKKREIPGMNSRGKRGLFPSMAGKKGKEIQGPKKKPHAVKGERRKGRKQIFFFLGKGKRRVGGAKKKKEKMAFSLPFCLEKERGRPLSSTHKKGVRSPNWVYSKNNILEKKKGTFYFFFYRKRTGSSP